MINDELMVKLLDRDGELKDIDWAQKMVSLIMLNAKQIITKGEYERREAILMGSFPDVHFDKIFKGEVMDALRKKLTKNNTLYFFERIRMAMIDERTQADLTITVNSLDPEKLTKKKQDKDLLKNRKGIENLISEVTGNNGMPPQKFKDEDYHGNVGEFDANGGDEFDTTELDDFFDRAWGLKDEWAYQNIVNDVFQGNEVLSTYDQKINDIQICLHNFSRVYVDAMDGAIKIKHVKPYEPFILHGTGSNNYKDAQGWSIPMETNVRGFIRMFGSQVDLARDWNMLVTAAYGPHHKFTGLSEAPSVDPLTGRAQSGIIRYGEDGNLLDFKRFCDLPIGYRYSEWKTITRTTTISVVTAEGNITTERVRPNDPRVDGAQADIKEKEDTYYAYSLDVNSVSPKIMKYGLVFMQQFEGLNDEYSGFTFKATKRNGVPTAMVLEPFWHMLNVTFKMLEMLVNDIKPDGYLVNFSSMIRIAQELAKATDTPTDTKRGIDMFLAMIQNSPNVVMDQPKAEDGSTLGGGTSSVMPNKNGLNDSAVDITKIIDWVEGKAALYTGTQGLDLASGDDGFKLSIERKKRTRAATAFIDFIMLDHLKDTAITVINYAQDVSKFKDLPAYKYLNDSVGYKVMEYIASRKKSPHRYGAFVQTFNNDIEILEIRQAANDALAKQQISYEQWLVLRSFKNQVQAAMYMAYERKRAKKQAETDARAALIGQDALAQKQADREVALENLKGEWRMKAYTAQAQGFISAAQINSQATLQAKVIQEQGQNERLAADAINEINKIAENDNRIAQAPVQT